MNNFQKTIEKKWEQMYPSMPMNSHQQVLLEVFKQWIVKVEEDKISPMLWFYAGEGRGHTMLWRTISEGYDNEVILVFHNMTYAKIQGFEDSLSIHTLCQSDVAGKILIFDMGGGHPSRNYFNKVLLKHKPKGIVIS